MKRTAFITRKVLALVSRSGTACTAWLGAALFVPPAKSSCAAAFRGSRRRRARATIGDSYLSCVIAFVVSLCLIGVAEARAAVTQRTECSHLDPSQCALVTEYPIPPPPQYSTNPGGIAPGPDGRMWFTENAGAAQGIGAITPSGQITQYTIPTGGSHPGSIVAGPDGRMWFSEDLTNKIGAVTTTGQFTEYPLPGGSVGPYDLAVGSDGRLWFTEEAVYGKSDEGGDFIGAITTAGQITIYPVFAMPGGLTEGADGRIWFLDENGNIDAVATDGTVTAYPLPEAFHETVDITAGSDGRLWITNIGGVAAVTTTGVVTVYYDSSVPLVGRQDPNSSGAWIISSGPDGRMWYFDLGQDRLSAMTTSGVQSGVFLPIGVDPQTAGGSALATAPSGAHHMAEGFGKLWFTDGYPDDEIGAVTLNVSRPTNGQGTNSAHPSPACVVPKITGLSLRQARKRLAKAHCTLGRVSKRKSHKRAWRIISQRPMAGSRHGNGSPVTVLVSKR